MSWIWIFLIMVTARHVVFGAEFYRGPKSDHFDGDKFFNPSGGTPKSFLQVIKWQLQGQRAVWPDWVENSAVPQIRERVSGEEDISLTFVNHATLLIQTESLNILTDPVWSKRVSPLSWIGPSRVRNPGVRFEDLPPIDVVLISHNHYDHMDIETLKRLKEKFNPKFFVALGDKAILQSEDISSVEEMDWWQAQKLAPNVSLHFVPAKHWSGRSLNDRYRSLWGGYVLETSKRKIYFAGDAGYSSHFKEIRERFGPISLALLPIGAYEPRWFMRDYHMNPAEAVQAHLDLSATWSVGMHFGTFQLTDESIGAPVHDLEMAREKLGVSPEAFLTLLDGETKVFKP